MAVRQQGFERWAEKSIEDVPSGCDTLRSQRLEPYCLPECSFSWRPDPQPAGGTVRTRLLDGPARSVSSWTFPDVSRCYAAAGVGTCGEIQGATTRVYDTAILPVQVSISTSSTRTGRESADAGPDWAGWEFFWPASFGECPIGNRRDSGGGLHNGGCGSDTESERADDILRMTSEWTFESGDLTNDATAANGLN